MGRSPIVVSMGSIYRSLLALSTLYVCYDEALGERYKVIRFTYNTLRLLNIVGQAFFLALSTLSVHHLCHPEPIEG